MDLTNSSAVVTGGASGLGLATVEALVARGVAVTIVDLPRRPARTWRPVGRLVTFGPADVDDAARRRRGAGPAVGRAPLRALVHCAGRGGTVRARERTARPATTTSTARSSTSTSSGRSTCCGSPRRGWPRNEPVDGERGVCVLTASVAAWEGQIGQIPYASAKAGVVGMTLVAARDPRER